MILDYKGRPIVPAVLPGEQAVQTWSRSYAMLAPFLAQTPNRIAAILRQAACGEMYAQSLLFADMEEKDPHIAADMQKRKGALAGLPWAIQPWDDSPLQSEMAAAATAMLTRLSPADLFFALADGIAKGISAVELMWDMAEGRMTPLRAVQRPLGWFQWRVVDVLPTDELALNNMTLAGEPLTPGKWILHAAGGGCGNPFRNALYRNLAWLYLFRNYALKSWNQYIEIFGIPLRIGKFPAGAGEAEKTALLDALEGMFGDSVVAIPDSSDITIDRGGGSGNNDPHLAFMDWSAKEISKAILGATLTSESGGKGSYAMAKIHNDVRMDILELDARAISETLNRDLIRPFVALNWGEQPQYPYIEFTLPEEDQRVQTAAALKTLWEIGFTDVPMWWLHEMFGIPAPDKGEDTLALHQASPATPAAQTPPPETKTAAQTAKNAKVPGKTPLPDAADAMQAELDTMLKPVMNFIQNATSFDDIATRLYDLYPDLDANRFQALVGRAMFATGLWGYIS